MKASSSTTRLAIACLTAAGLAGSAAWAQNAPADQRTIRVVSVRTDAASPNASVWRKVPAKQVALEPAFAGHAAIVGAAVTDRITVQAARTRDRLYVRLAWTDRAADTAVKDTTGFVDGAAVQFAVNGRDSTPPYMGDADNPVNVWYWRADGRIENVVAHGFGSATRVASDRLKSAAERTATGWAIVLSRPLRVDPAEGVVLNAKGAVPVAFAAWDGANQERDGLKAVTLEWWRLRF